MKRFLALLLSALMVLSLLTACGDKTTPSDGDDQTVTDENGSGTDNNTDDTTDPYDAVRNYSDFVLTTRRGDGEAAVAAAAPSGGRAETPSAQPSASGDDRAAQADKQEPVRYTVQVLASAKPVSLRSSEFKSYRGKVRQLKASGALPYKYCVGEYDTEAAAQRHLRQVRKVFPDAFVVRCQGTEIVK